MTGCLAQYSYFVESKGEALIIDPIYEPDIYLNLLKIRKSKLKYILETHFHADFVSGHFPLAKETKAMIVFGPNENPALNIYKAQDKEYLPLGNINIEVLHTPGHTLESCCFLLRDSKGDPHSVFTGDTLFLNEVGRPDLACNAEIKPSDLATMLFQSIKYHIEPLPDNVILYPGHGAGSPCGKSIGKGDHSTIGEQRKTNFALDPNIKLEEFISLATSDLPKPLVYMPHDVAANKGEKALASEKEILQKFKKNYAQFKDLIDNNPEAFLLDTREQISNGIVKGATHISFNSTLSIFVGTLVRPEQKILLVCENDEITKQTITRLLRIGYDNILGYLQGGISTWLKSKGAMTPMKIAQGEEFKRLLEEKKSDFTIMDIRNNHEWDAGHLENAKHVQLRDLKEKILNRELDELKEKKIYVHCRGGPRGLAGQSIFLANGFNDVTSIAGGLIKLIELGVPTIKN